MSDDLYEICERLKRNTRSIDVITVVDALMERMQRERVASMLLVKGVQFEPSDKEQVILDIARKVGRKPIGQRAMTAAERQAKRRKHK